MAITLTGTPAITREGETVNLFTASNKLLFEFTAGASEASLQVQVQDASSGVLGTLKTVPFNSDSTLTIDAGFILRNQLNNDDDSDNARGSNDFSGVGSTAPFKLAYRVGGTGSYTVLSTLYQAVRGVRQYGSTYGASVADYTPLMTGTTVDYTGKFLTLFENPVLFWYADGTPATSADVSVFQSQLAFPMRLADYTVIQILRAIWRNKAGTSSNTQSYVDAGTNTAIITFAIPEAESAFEWDTVGITVGTNNGAGNLGNTAIDTITFQIQRVCNNPTALKWINSLGAWEVWVFEGRTPYSLDTDSLGGEYGIYQADISTATESRRYLNKSARKSVSLFADNLLLDQVRAISEIVTSPHVIMYVGDLVGGTDFTDWEGVTIDAGSFRVEDTYDKRHKISIDVNMIDILTISN